MRLARLLSPSTVAVVGGGWAHNVIEQLQKMGFDGQIAWIHPKPQSMGGVIWRPDLAALSFAPDAVFVAVNRTQCVELVEQARALGCGGVVCFASGFAEAQAELGDASSLQSALIAASGKMPLLGPNCYGLVNYLDRVALWPDQHGGLPVERGVAIITQSSNIAINLSMTHSALPIAYLLTAGNQAVVDQTEMIEAALYDTRVTAVGVHIEGIQSAEVWQQVANTANTLGKRIVVLKVGQSVQAQAAALSHTAAMSGAGHAAQAFFQRLGCVWVSHLDVFLNTLKLCHFETRALPNTLMSLSCSGGEAGLVADLAERYHIATPPLSDLQCQQLGGVLGEKVHLANPLDYHTYIWGDLQGMRQMFSAALQSEVGICMLVLDFPRQDRCDDQSWAIALEAFASADNHGGAIKAVVATLPENMPEHWAMRCLEMGLLPFGSIELCLQCLGAVAQWQPPAEGALLALRSGELELLDQPMQALTDLQVNTPKRLYFDSRTNIQLGELPFPCVLKAEGLAHKTEQGGVVLNIQSQQDLQAAIDAMPEAAGYSLEAQITDVVAEILVGIEQNPPFGWVLSIGEGGIYAELARDVQHLMLPCHRCDIKTALQGLRKWPVLQGYRNQTGANIEALIDTIYQLTQCIETQPRWQSLECNPVLACRDQAVVVDALITRSSG
ncbi:MAG: acetate--CoA ligase family protein [Gammaproteobacteria bacterium]|nr:acetate--CoA ligase family protein [Gammaproteobacteria bacterium]